MCKTIFILPFVWLNSPQERRKEEDEWVCFSCLLMHGKIQRRSERIIGPVNQSRQEFKVKSSVWDDVAFAVLSIQYTNTYVVGYRYQLCQIGFVKFAGKRTVISLLFWVGLYLKQGNAIIILSLSPPFPLNPTDLTLSCVFRLHKLHGDWWISWHWLFLFALNI